MVPKPLLNETALKVKEAWAKIKKLSTTVVDPKVAANAAAWGVDAEVAQQAISAEGSDGQRIGGGSAS